MEALSLGIGIVSLAALFESCLDAAERVSSYQSSQTDTKDLEAQFAADKLRFDQWGRRVGLRADGPSSGRHPALNDVETFRVVSDLLTTLGRTLETADDLKLPDPSSSDAGHRRLTESKRSKVTWALWNKKKRIQEVTLFGTFVQKLYDVIPLEEKDDSASLQAFSDSWLDELRGVTTQLERQMQSENQRDIQNWLLGRYDGSDLYDEVAEGRLEGTCDWILTNPSFETWDRRGENSPKTLWINAPAGFGKTVLCSRLIQYAVGKDEGPVAYFFFSAAFDSREDPLIAIRSWLDQIISCDAEAFNIVRQDHDAAKTKQAKRTSLTKLLQQVLQSVHNCTLVVDGLDECTTRSQVTTFLEVVEAATEGTTARLLAVSRDVAEIRSGFKPGFAEVKITPENVKSDVQSYSQSIVEKKLPNKSGDIKSSISTQMADRSEGQFLWVKIQAGSLKKSFNQKQLQKSVEEAPVGLDRLYERDWAEIQNTNKRDTARAISILRWATFALRPLSVCEMVEAVLLRADSEDFPEDELPDCIDQDYINEEILGLCGSLIEVRTPTQGDIGLSTVHLPHFTVKQFVLVNLPSLTNGAALQSSYESAENMRLGRLCLRYILHPFAWQGEVEPSMSLRSYAAGSWARHCKLGKTESESLDAQVLDLTTTLFDEKHPSWHLYRRWHDAKRDAESPGRHKRADEDDPAKPLYFACFLSLVDTAHHIIREDSASVHHMSTFKRNGMLSAAANGHTKIVEALLDAGLSANMTDGQGESIISLAATLGCNEVVKLLLDRGADVTKASENGMTPLYVSVLHGRASTAELLLGRGAMVNLETTKLGGWTPLGAAAMEGHVEMAALLLDRGANISLAHDLGHTPLYSASLKGRLGMVEALLDRGADLTIASSDGCTPLNAAAEQGHTDVVKLLIDRGADITVASKFEMTPFYSACLNGHLETAQLLLEMGSDIESRNAHEWTPLNAASVRGHDKVVKFLIEHGADITTTNNVGTTVLHSACSSGLVDVIRVLLQKGAYINGTNNLGHTPLREAVISGHNEVVAALLAQGADPTINDRAGVGALRSAARLDHVEIVERLLKWYGDNQLSADGDADEFGRTALFHAARTGRVEVVRVLATSCPSMKSVIDWRGCTPLSAAARNGRIEVVDIMLEQGTDALDDKDARGRTAYDWASRNEDEPMKELLSAYSRGARGKMKLAFPGKTAESNVKRARAKPNSYCDACAIDLRLGSKYYKCSACCNGSFALCADCKDCGETCRDDSHEWEAKEVLASDTDS